MGFRDLIRGITRPDPDVLAVDPEELRLRLMGLNQPTSPWQVRDGVPEKVDLVAEWKTTDPYWQEIFAKVRLNETFSTHLRFRLDAHEVRSRDRCYGGDWYTDSDGNSSYREGWKTGQMQDKSERTIDGQHYRFDTQDFKIPLKKTVLEAGWIYRAVVMRKL